MTPMCSGPMPPGCMLTQHLACSRHSTVHAGEGTDSQRRQLSCSETALPPQAAPACQLCTTQPLQWDTACAAMAVHREPSGGHGGSFERHTRGTQKAQAAAGGGVLER